MHYYIVSYVKRKYYGRNNFSDAYELYCEYSKIIPVIGWNFDFWLNQLLNGKEFHILNSEQEEILDQYLVTESTYDDKFEDKAYYQINFNEKE